MTLLFSDMLKEADRKAQRSGRNRVPFVLEVSDGDTVTCNYPDAGVLLSMSNIDAGDALNLLQVFFQNNARDYRRLMEDLAPAPMEAVEVLVQNMNDFWGFDQSKVPGNSEE